MPLITMVLSTVQPVNMGIPGYRPSCLDIFTDIDMANHIWPMVGSPVGHAG